MMNLRKIVSVLLCMVCLSNAYADVYCSRQVTSSDGKKSVTVTCKSLGGDKYRVEINSKDVITQIVSTNMYCNPGTVNIGSKLTLQSDKKTITSSDFTCASSPNIYVGAFTLKFITATCNFDITGAEFSDCDESAPVWDSDPYLLCGGKRQISLMTSTHDDSGVAGYKITIDGCDMDSPLTAPVQKHSGAISVSLLKCRITLDETSDYTATIIPYDRVGNEGEAKTITGIKLKEAEPVVMESVSCGAITPTTIQLLPVTSGGVATAYQVTYGTTTIKCDGSESFTVEGLEPSTEYTFTVNAVDGCGNVSATSATATCTTTYTPHGGADAATELDEKVFRPTSTGNCGTSIAGGTAFSVAGASGKFNHTIEEIDKFGELTLARTFTEAYSNGYFHESGTPSAGENQYAIVSNPKVLNGNYKRITDKKNRLVLALGQDPSGAQYQMLTLKRNHLENGSFRISFNVEDLTDGTQCPQSGLPNMRQLWIHATQNGNVIYDGPHEFTVGTSKQFTVSGNAQKGDVVAVEIKARFLSSCTAIAISDLTIYGCMERAIETPDGFTTYCENSDVTLMAVGTTATKFKWQSSPNNKDWTDLQGVGDDDVISVTATLGNKYYRYVEVDGSKKESQSFNLLGQVCCTYLAEQTIVWKETFGNGTGRWQNPNVKNHTFVPGITTKIDDGGYAVVSNSNDACPSCCAWPANKTDHTGDTNGGFLVINVKNVKPPVLIYSQTITPADGFCKSTYYNLSLFASNLSAASNLPSSFMFEVVDAATGNVLGRGETGDVNSFGMESWLNYGTSFAPENSTSVIINIYNTGEAGYGNDVVLDDIAVSVCNAKVDLYADYPKTDAVVPCGTSAILTAVPDGNMQTFFGTDKPYCLWLKSLDGGSTFSIVNEASGYGNDKYEYTSVSGENATFRVILAVSEENALKIYRGDPIEECVIYTKTNLASVKCNGCVEPQFVLPAATECSTDKQSYSI
ncbi:MAG: fibronectin type III domain-containing protein, partial [Paludibacteraceae bacterium]|nr:fibronectin type III domain-containing protein [Paludibacteraceae bacterium]